MSGGREPASSLKPFFGAAESGTSSRLFGIEGFFGIDLGGPVTGEKDLLNSSRASRAIINP